MSNTTARAAVPEMVCPETQTEVVINRHIKGGWDFNEKYVFFKSHINATQHSRGCVVFLTGHLVKLEGVSPIHQQLIQLTVRMTWSKTDCAGILSLFSQ